VERLEDRTLLTGGTLQTATPLTLTPLNTARASGFLAGPNEVDLYAVRLGAGDRVTASVSAQAAGSGLQAALRAFGPAGQPVALDAQEGGDPSLAFQAAAAGTYYVGVSSQGDNAYDPVAGGGSGGLTTGQYTLDVGLTLAAPLRPDVQGESFRLGQATAGWGDAVPVSFTVGNRGGAAAGLFTIQVLASAATNFAAPLVLQAVPEAGLGTGQAVTDNLTIVLPDAAQAGASGLPTSGPAYLGLQVAPAGGPAGSFDGGGVYRGEDWEQLQILTPAAASGTNHSAATAQALADLNSQVTGSLGAGQRDWYQVTVSAGGVLTVRVGPVGSGLTPRLTLYGPDGQTRLLASDGVPGGNPLASLTQYLQPGTYYLAVSGQSGSGAYTLTSTFAAGSSPAGPAPVSGAVTLAVGDLNNDGRLDLVVGGGNTVTVLLGSGHGSFLALPPMVVGANVNSVAVADVNGDGKPDLVVTDDGTYSPYYGSPHDQVSVLLGNGDGTFQPALDFSIDSPPPGHALLPFSTVTVADVNGDGKLDLVTANYTTNDVSVLLGNGDGTFQPARNIPAGTDPRSVKVADVNGDGLPDMVVSNFYPALTSAASGGAVNVLLGNGDGSFQAPQKVTTADEAPIGATVVDMNGDGRPDLVLANAGGYTRDGTVDVLLNQTPAGSRTLTFTAQASVDAGAYAGSVAVADVNGDGVPDVIVGAAGVRGSYDSGTVSVLLGNPDHSFQPPQTVAVGGSLTAALVADFNGDGRPDLVAATGNAVVVLPGNGDGSFRPQPVFPAGPSPQAVTEADVNGDGRPDLLVDSGHGVNLLLGQGDGSFQPPQAIPGAVGGLFAVTDLNGDGRPDLVTVDAATDTLSILLGNGDGTFHAPGTLPTAAYPVSVAAVDVNGDGIPDLVVGYGGAAPAVGVRLGKGDGSFAAPRLYATGTPDLRSVTVADVDGDGHPDLIETYNPFSAPGYSYGAGSAVVVLPGNGDGSFAPPVAIPAGAVPHSPVVADLNGDGIPDLVVVNGYGLSGTVSVLKGDGGFAFEPPQVLAGVPADTMAVADVNGDGVPDLVALSQVYDSVSVLLGRGDGSFRAPMTFPANPDPNANPGLVAVGDVNGDGIPDLVLGNQSAASVSVLLGKADGTFQPVLPASAVAVRSTPYLADLNGDHQADTAVLDSAGNILFRAGLPGPAGSFAPPVVLNNTGAAGQVARGAVDRPARDLAVVQSGSGNLLATADALATANPSAPGGFVYTVSVYAVGRDAQGDVTVHRSTAFTTPFLPTRIASADLNGDGLGDLVVANGLDNSVTVALQTAPGQFGPPVTLPVGVAPSDVALVDENGDGKPDIVVTDQAGGAVTVLLNNTPAGTATPSFGPPQTFAATTDPHAVTAGPGGPTVNSLDQLVSLAAGAFTGNGHNDLAVINGTGNAIDVLAADGQGGFANPQAGQATSTSDGLTVNNQPGPVVAADFNGDGKTDLAVLMQDRGQVWIYLGNGDGTFTHAASVPVGRGATGLSLAPGSGPGRFDLLVGNEFGDVLRLVGDGRGGFEPAVGDGAALAVQPGLLAGGKPGVLVGNEVGNEVTLQTAPPGSPDFAPVQTLAASDPLAQLGPAAVQWARLDPGSTAPDAVVVNSASNDVVIYRPTTGSSGQVTYQASATYFVGTGPAGVTVQDVNGDGIPDLLVADEGSNQVSVLFGALDANGNWTATPGPRLSSGGVGPVSAVAMPGTGGGLPDLLVANGQSGTLALLPGVGQGFFNDRSPQTIDVGPFTQAPVLAGAPGQVIVDTDSGQLVAANVHDPTAPPQLVFDPAAFGQAPVAAVTPLGADLLVALQDGTVEQLQAGSSAGDFTPGPELQPLTGALPGEPASLAELPAAGGGMEALVTVAGNGQVFVFGPQGVSAGPPPAPPELGPAAPGPAAAEAAPVAEAPLVLLVTLQAPSLPEGGGAAGGAADAAAQGALPQATAAQVEGKTEGAAEQAAGAVGEADAEALALVWADGDVLPRVEDGLRELDLGRPPQAPPDGPTSLGQPPAAADDWGRALAALWQAGAVASPGDDHWDPAAGVFTCPNMVGARRTGPVECIARPEVVTALAPAPYDAPDPAAFEKAQPPARLEAAADAQAPQSGIGPARAEVVLAARPGTPQPAYLALAAGALAGSPLDRKRPPEPTPAGRRSGPGRQPRRIP
jgi:hypothetical protein